MQHMLLMEVPPGTTWSSMYQVKFDVGFNLELSVSLLEVVTLIFSYHHSVGPDHYYKKKDLLKQRNMN